MYPPSMIAAASVGAAIQGLSARLEHKWASANDLVFRLHEITGIEPVSINVITRKIQTFALILDYFISLDAEINEARKIKHDKLIRTSKR